MLEDTLLTTDNISKQFSNSTWTHAQDLTPLVDISFGQTAYDTDTKSVVTWVSLSNNSSVPLRGPILLAVDGLSNGVRLANSSGTIPFDTSGWTDANLKSLAGSSFVHTSARPFESLAEEELLPSQTLTIPLLLTNPLTSQFAYSLHVIGSLNHAPEFDSQPALHARAGSVYRYWAHAQDADHDPVTYALLQSPAGMVIDPATGYLTWPTNIQSVGTHVVQVIATDSLGAEASQTFSLSITGDESNSPPSFTSVPIVDAYVGEQYEYYAIAKDPDQDPLTYRLLAKPPGMTSQPIAADEANPSKLKLLFTPSVAMQGQYFTVEVSVEDGHGGEGAQAYQVLVHPKRNNLPPVFTTIPPLVFDASGSLGATTGTVSPKGIDLELANGQSSLQAVSVTLPQDIPMVDVFMLMDDTGSFAPTAPTIAGAFQTIINRLKVSRPKVDFGFGVGRFEDYGGDATWAESIDRPFLLNQSILPQSDPDMLRNIVRALQNTAPGQGGDEPETLIEALYQLATGQGFDGDGDRTNTTSGLAGQVSTQVSPGGSGDVPQLFIPNFDRYRQSAIDLAVGTQIAIPPITSTSSFAIRLAVNAGQAIRFDDQFSNNNNNNNKWQVVDSSGHVLSLHRRGTHFVKEFTENDDYYLIPQLTTGTAPASTISAFEYQVMVQPLELDRDVQLQFTYAEEPRRFTFSLSQPTTLIFDVLAASDQASWELEKDSSTVFSSSMKGIPKHLQGFVDTNGSEAQRTADQAHALPIGNYTLTVRGTPSTQPTRFRVSKFRPAEYVTVTSTSSTSVPVTSEKLSWIKVVGNPGEKLPMGNGYSFVLDADGQVFPYKPFPFPGYGILTFGQQPEFWVAISSSKNENVPVVFSLFQSPTPQPTATPVVFGTPITGRLSLGDAPAAYEIQLNEWSTFRIDGDRNSLRWILQSPGGMSYTADASGLFPSDEFLNQDVLLAPGTHRLTIQAVTSLVSSKLDYSFKVSTASFTQPTYRPAENLLKVSKFGPGTRWCGIS